MSGVVRAIKSAVKSVGDTVVNAVKAVGTTLENIIKNPLPTLETLALDAIGIPPPISSAIVTAANGGNLSDVLKSAASAYVGQQVSTAVTSEMASYDPTAAPAAGQSTFDPMEKGTPTDILSPTKIVPAIAGGAAQGGTGALLAGQDLTKGAIKGAEAGGVSGVAQGVGQAASSQFTDPLAQKVAGGAATGATTAALTGKSIAGGATTGGVTAGLNYGVNQAVQGIGSALGQDTTNADSAAFDKQISDLITSGGATKAGTPATSTATDISSVATGSQPSPTALGAADVALLDTSQAGVANVAGKKGGKYPWGDPEGTTALKEGLGV